MKAYIAYSALIIGLSSSCIDKFTPENISEGKVLVVDALITNESELQEVTLSWSSLTASPFWDPVSNAKVVVVDNWGNSFEFIERNSEKGVYDGVINEAMLSEGTAFKVNINTHEGKEYESEFEEMLDCPAIDSVYYEVNNNYYEGNSRVPERGVQFFIDLKADSTYTSYYKWNTFETFEYRATWPIETYWAGEFITLDRPDYSYSRCYMTEPVYKIFTATTLNLDENVYLNFPFHFVNNQTQRLYFRYSLLVKQNSISEKAYDYWLKLKENNQTSGGLYDSQPQQVRGNVFCISNTDEPVLGFFGVSSVTQTRISFTQEDLRHELIYDHNIFCDRWKPDRLDFITQSLEETWPIYMAPPPEDDNGLWYALQYCFDCRLWGGVLEIPEFWEE